MALPFSVSSLIHNATSNHTHLLVIDTGEQTIPKSFQLIASRTAHEFNIRKVGLVVTYIGNTALKEPQAPSLVGVIVSLDHLSFVSSPITSDHSSLLDETTHA